MWYNKNLLKNGVITLVVVLLVWVLIETYRPLDADTDGKFEFIINKGEGSAKVARLLAEQGLVRSRYLFIGYTLLAGKEKEFKAGRYLVSPSMNIPEIVKIFSEGKAEPEGILVTIPEGSNSWETAKKLELEFKSLKFKDLKFNDLNNFLDNEGYLFPDTYWFAADESEERIIKKMKDNFKEKTKEIFKNLNFSKKEETMIIASLLEKEVRTEEDMRLVAGIIYKRLELGMPLQIDATVAYGACLPLRQTSSEFQSLKVSKFKYCDVSQVNLVENIKVDSPYNTYTRKGLPAGPISNPGLKALNAALNPVASDYLYYLSAKEDGRTIFSKTPEEHQRNRQKFLIW